MVTSETPTPDPANNKAPRPRRRIPLSLRTFVSILVILGRFAVWESMRYRPHVATRETDRLGVTVLQTRSDSANEVGAEQRQREHQLQIEVLHMRLAAELDAKTHTGSGNPNGWVWGIDPVKKTVCWVGIGHADGVRPKTVCEVRRRPGYDPEVSQPGIDDADEWISVGQIEITKVEGSHQSEARILTENADHKIARGDSIVVPSRSAK